MARKSTKKRKSAQGHPSGAPAASRGNAQSSSQGKLQGTLQGKKRRLSRRDMIGTLAIYGAGAAVLAGGGTALAMDFRRKMVESDLSQIGNGRPTIVQIHDPQCSLCTSLQKATRRALRSCDDAAQTQYLVANITTLEGADFQARMGLPNVTLVFFDGSGTHVHTIQGVTPADQIKAQIRARLT